MLQMGIEYIGFLDELSLYNLFVYDLYLLYFLRDVEVLVDKAAGWILILRDLPAVL
jgi:hypothetical protein